MSGRHHYCHHSGPLFNKHCHSFCLGYFYFFSFATQKNSHFATAIAVESSFSTKGIYPYVKCQNGKQY